MFGISLRNKNRLAGVLITPIGSIGVCKIEGKKRRELSVSLFCQFGHVFQNQHGLL